MGIISVSLPADGSTADVADVNTPITTIVNEFNGNIDNDNIKSGAAIATSKLASDNGIAAGMLSSSAITLGYAQITSNFTTTGGTSSAAVTGLGVTVTIPSGTRHIKITAFCRDLLSTGTQFMHFGIWDGTVGSGTQLADSQIYAGATTQGNPGICIAVVTPSAGSKTYNVGAYASTGNFTVEAASTYPAFILVEAI